MTTAFPCVYLVRHGETPWSRSRQHTGRTDLPLTATGERDACALAAPLRVPDFRLVLTSPLQRATRTCELAGFGDRAERDADLLEWDYGEYEGLRNDQVLARHPGWRLFRDGCAGGESPAQVSHRVDRVIARARATDGNVLLFSSGHLLRALAARWLGLEVVCGELLLLDTASLSILGYEHDRNEPVLRLWNDTRHRRP